MTTERFPSLPAATVRRRIWLRVGTLLDGCSTTPRQNAHILYNKNTILHVGDASNPPPARLLNPGQIKPDLDLPQYTLLPGLIEAHAHLFLEGGELDAEKRKANLRQHPQDLLKAAQKRLEKLLPLGIIAVRDAGDKHGVGLALGKLYMSEARLPMPYIDSPGAAIHHKGRYGAFMAEPIENYNSPEDCVAARVQAGAERIKLIATDIIDFKAGKVTREPQMSASEISQLVKAAQVFGKQTLAHASGENGIENVIEGGVDSVEHGFFIREDQLAKMRDRQIAWVPTFAPLQRQIDYAALMGWDERTISNLRKILDQHAASLRKAHEMGVPVIAGSDAGSYGVAHGDGFLYELELMERAGLPALAVINAATGNSSDHLKFEEKFAQIKTGYQSRFILTRHSPLKGIANLRKHKYIVFDGVAHEFGKNIDITKCL